jgi:hypothetical protein
VLVRENRPEVENRLEVENRPEVENLARWSQAERVTAR